MAFVHLRRPCGEETYNYYELPFCKAPSAVGKKPSHKWGGLGEVLEVGRYRLVPVQPRIESARSQRLKLSCDELLSSFAFDFNLRRFLEGNELIDSNMEFKFRMDQPKTAVCVDPLDERKVKKFTKAIKHHYWYEFFMDDLPIWGFVGEFVDGTACQILPATSSCTL
jgi:transmembrane 9 superfamily protein 3